MNAQKIITTTESIDLSINGITLLSIEEARKLPMDIRKCKYSWWLCSQGIITNSASFVDGGSGRVEDVGFIVETIFGVRPALKISNLKSFNLQIGDKVKVFNYTWTIISQKLALCDEIVGRCKFREDWLVKGSNDYDTSDVKKWLEKWYMNQCHAEESEVV